MRCAVWLAESHHDILAAASHIWSFEEEGEEEEETVKSGKPSSSSSLLLLLFLLLLLLLLLLHHQIVCLCSTTRQQWVHHWKRGSAQEPRREIEGKEKNEDLTSQKEQCVESPRLNHENPVDICLSEEGGGGWNGALKKSLAISVDARSQKWRQWDSDFLPPARHFFTVICSDAIRLLCVQLAEERLETESPPTLQPQVRTETFPAGFLLITQRHWCFLRAAEGIVNFRTRTYSASTCLPSRSMQPPPKKPSRAMSNPRRSNWYKPVKTLDCDWRVLDTLSRASRGFFFVCFFFSFFFFSFFHMASSIGVRKLLVRSWHFMAVECGNGGVWRNRTMQD